MQCVDGKTLAFFITIEYSISKKVWIMAQTVNVNFRLDEEVKKAWNKYAQI